MDFIELIKVGILAAFQGVAEFLPISSSGHLQVLGFLLKTDPEKNLFLGVLLHGGTLLAILVFYFHQIWKILAKKQFNLMLAVIVGSIPAGIVGVAIKKSGIEDAIFGSLWVPAIGFAVTALLLFFAMKSKTDDSEATAVERISLKQAVVIGLAQAVAITPGISRSGSTIAAGLRVKLKKADCAEFSFLLAIPAIAGAILLETLEVLKQRVPVSAAEMGVWAVGFVISAVVGYFSLKLLLGMLKRGKLNYFAWYLVFASIATFGIVLFTR
ncbi:MAG: undecaprenyl-diphosphate phosphatase [Victivallaceae bacterium]|nr:undecaprenyl-diphosphate phosphatase [Victivallaceae bacterium]